MKKQLLIILGIIVLFFGCSPFEKEAKEYEFNSEASKKIIAWIIRRDSTTDKPIRNSYVYENKTGIDPFYYLKFSLDEADFFNVFDSTWTFSDSASKFFIPSEIPPNRRHLYDIPNWYNPTIDSTSLFFIKEFPSGSKSGMYHRKAETCFVFYSTY